MPEALRRFDISGRVALVTGASSGLGEGLARALASAGARVAVVARRQDRLAELVPRIAGELGAPEILVNAAGMIFSREPAEREPAEEIRRTLELNLVAPFRLAQEVFPH